MNSVLRHSILLVCSVFFVNGTWALDDKDGTSVNCTNFNQYGNPYFGDTHVHTTLSVDAFTQGVDTTPEQAYRFAKGEQIGLHPFDGNGDPTRFVQLERPLDFAMVSDHAEFFGEYNICTDTDPAHPSYNDPNCVLLRERDNEAFLNWNVILAAAQNNVSRFPFCGVDGSICTNEAPSTWQIVQDAADLFYDRSADCEFTTFVGYEYTGSPLSFGAFGLETLNFHRNVLFLNSMVPERPTSYLDAPYTNELWDELQSGCLDLEDGSNECDVITIPHNTNLSQGLLFETTRSGGDPWTLTEAVQSFKFDRLVEIMQHKGQSECLPLSGDELCGYEVVPWGHLAGNFINPTQPREAGSVRTALKDGLARRQVYKDINIFKYGIIGSSDTHLGTPGLVDETADYPGHGGAAEGTAGSNVNSGFSDAPQFNPGGLAVVWAQQNSRRSLFDAMKRREVYATSGPRHIVRFYGSWQNDLPPGICSDPGRTEIAHNSAVPMGSTLPATTPGDTTPQFLVYAAKDAGTAANPGNDLQRIQIIKGWTDGIGGTQEKIYDVACSNGLAPDPITHRCPDNEAGVDLNSCATTGTGEPDLCALWQDPEFNSNQNAFYYARVVENPSCRWTQRQCLAAPVTINCADPGSVPEEYDACCDEEIPKTVQERSWTSPIWFDPALYMPPGC